MDYSFEEKVDVKLITLFIIDSFKMPVPNAYIVDTLAIEQFINYFDLQQHMGELEEGEFLKFYVEDGIKFYSLSEKGKQALEFFSQRIPKTVRERLLRAIKIKVKDLRNALSIKADYNKVLKEIQQRDYQDTHREVAPLKMSRDSIKLDTSDMDIDQVIASMKEIIAKKVGA